jgi:transcriptional regulator with XRE-family HTH domain
MASGYVDVLGTAEYMGFWVRMEEKMSFGTRIAQLRRRKGESLQKVADAAGVTKTHIWELERGTTRNPSLGVIENLANHFGVSIASLVGEDIDADDADQRLAHMFRLAKKVDEQDLVHLEAMIKSFASKAKD